MRGKYETIDIITEALRMHYGVILDFTPALTLITTLPRRPTIRLFLTSDTIRQKNVCVQTVLFVHIVQNLRNGQMDNLDNLVMLLFYNSHAGFFERIHVLANSHSIVWPFERRFLGIVPQNRVFCSHIHQEVQQEGWFSDPAA